MESGDYCQVGYKVSNLRVQIQFDFSNKMNKLQENYCIF